MFAAMNAAPDEAKCLGANLIAILGNIELMIGCMYSPPASIYISCMLFFLINPLAQILLQYPFLKLAPTS
jgi:hypothetical protein